MRTNRIVVYGAAIAGLALVLSAAGVRLMMRGMAGMHGASAEDHTAHGCEDDPTRTAEPPASHPA